MNLAILVKVHFHVVITRETRKYFTKKLEPYIETIQKKYERVEDNYLK